MIDPLFLMMNLANAVNQTYVNESYLSDHGREALNIAQIGNGHVRLEIGRAQLQLARSMLSAKPESSVYMAGEYESGVAGFVRGPSYDLNFITIHTCRDFPVFRFWLEHGLFRSERILDRTTPVSVKRGLPNV